MNNHNLMQLVEYGAQDVYLTANPQITFFRYRYDRYASTFIEHTEYIVDRSIVMHKNKRYNSSIFNKRL